MKKRLQGLIAGILIGATLTSGAVLAKSGTNVIEALFNNIKIYVDGVKIEPKDATGKAVEPFIYDGTTYLPVRAVGEAIGKTVTWDGATQSVYLDEKSRDVQYLMDVCPPYSGVGIDIDTLKMGGDYYDGFSLGLTSTDCYALINLNGSYSSMSMTIGPIDEEYFYADSARINFYLDNRKIKTIEIYEGDYPTEIIIPLNYAKQLKIENQHIDNGSPALIGFGNIIVK